MKAFLKIIFLCGIIVFTALSCEKDKDNNMKSQIINTESILGDWVNINFNQDTLFINDTVIWRSDTIRGPMFPMFCFRNHAYAYTIIPPDSIKIKYRGTYYIGCPEKTYYMLLDKQQMILTIENLNTYFPHYPGDNFKKLTK